MQTLGSDYVRIFSDMIITTDQITVNLFCTMHVYCIKKMCIYKLKNLIVSLAC